MPPLNYQPIINGPLPKEISSRWKCIRDFINFWCMPEDAPLHDRSEKKTPIIEKAEALQLGSISPSIRHWLTLAEEACERKMPQIRDCLMVEPIENHFEDSSVKDATIILMQAEGDIFWSVANKNFADDDPPVDVYQCFDDDRPPYFLQYPTVSEFVLAYISTYNSFALKKHEAFTVHLKNEQLPEIRQWFTSSLEIENQKGQPYRLLELLERENAVAFLNRSNRLEVSLFSPPETLEMPNFLRLSLLAELTDRQKYRAILGR